MTRYGLIAMSAKPFHAGHDGLIRLASNENDIVKLFVSISDRKRKGEQMVSGETMSDIWREFIEPSLPSNIHVSYGGSPIRKTYEFLGAENEAGSDDVYVIYSDPEDLTNNFPEKSLEKYMGDLYARGKIILEPIQRSETTDITGTQMRAWLSSGDMDSFISNLPASIRDRGAEIFDLLTQQ